MTHRLIKTDKSEFFAAKFSAATNCKQKWKAIREIGMENFLVMILIELMQLL